MIHKIILTLLCSITTLASIHPCHAQQLKGTSECRPDTASRDFLIPLIPSHDTPDTLDQHNPLIYDAPTPPLSSLGFPNPKPELYKIHLWQAKIHTLQQQNHEIRQDNKRLQKFDPFMVSQNMKIISANKKRIQILSHQLQELQEQNDTTHISKDGQ